MRVVARVARIVRVVGVAKIVRIVRALRTGGGKVGRAHSIMLLFNSSLLYNSVLYQITFYIL